MSSDSDFSFLAADAARKSESRVFGDRPVLVREGVPEGRWETVLLTFHCDGQRVRQARGDRHSEAWARLREELDARARHASEQLYEQTFSKLSAFELMASIETSLERCSDVSRSADIYTFELPIDYRAL
jgi:hypothetical protein